MRLSFKRGGKGFTLVELMVVMAIMAVLASIIIPAVTGTKQVSLDSQVKQDATSIETAVGKYNADSNVAEGLTTTTGTILGESVSQVVSNKWPEQVISTAYATEFPATVGTQANTVSGVTIKDKDGTTLYATGGATGHRLADFVGEYNAISSTALLSGGYLQEEPEGIDVTFSSTKPYHNYLWLVKKAAVGSDATAGRVVEVFSLITVTTNTADALVYQRIY